VILEVVDERRAELAERLLAGVGGHVLAEQVERLFPDAHRGAVRGGVDEARAREGVDPAFDRRVDLVGLHDLVADQIRVGLARRPFAAGQDRLASGAVAHEPRQAQVGGAGDDPLLARRQVQARATDRDHVVHDVEQLARAADRVPLDRSDPELLAVAGVDPAGQAAVDLVDVPHVTHDVEQVVDLAHVEEREVDARAEDALARVARVIDHATAEHPDLDLGIEQDQIDGGLGLVQRVPVLGV
jgi:hypothetical protein